jgi:ribosomal protein S18 acetylase RimI-like enzyme
MNIDFRTAEPSDVQMALPMIYSSGPHEFDYIFNVGNKTTADYLLFAFPTRFGTQSHRIFTVATANGQVAGIGALYTGNDNLRLSLGNFWNVFRFYGAQHTIKVAQRAGHIETILPPSAANAGYISQLGVKEEFRGDGVGTALIGQLIELTRNRGLRKCVLDVAITNPRAQALYERLGFKVVQENKWNYPDSKIHVPSQRRMELIFAK